MEYIKFEKQQLVNLEFSLNREFISSNKAGSYASTTVAFCNTRKYHGLLITPQKGLDGENHVLLHSLDETIIKKQKEFHLSVKRYPDAYSPKGHKYLTEFYFDKCANMIYRVGGTLLSKEILFAENDERVMIRYKVLHSDTPTRIRFQPFMAFRSVHKLAKANLDVLKKYQGIKNGIKTRMYHGYPHIHLQFSQKVDFISNPDWFYDVEYLKEKERGYDYQEDLYQNGYFETELSKGETIIFTAGLEEILPQNLKKRFNQELKNRISRKDFTSCLKHSARQFVIKEGDAYKIKAGFPWYGSLDRDTFIALPGLTLSAENKGLYRKILDTMLFEYKAGILADINNPDVHCCSYDSADTLLWFFWAIQKYCLETGKYKNIWKEYGKTLTELLLSLKNGFFENIYIASNGLYYAGATGKAMTWMNALVDGKGVTPRTGYAVELNLLWFNALSFFLELASKGGESAENLKVWQELKLRFEDNFEEVFWSSELETLADYVTDTFKDYAVRPNMVLCSSLPYSPLSENKQHKILTIIEKELLTPRGLRSLTPVHPEYQGVCEGDQRSRDLSCHQGASWPWLLGHFVEGYLKLNRRSGLHKIKKIFHSFEEEMFCHGLGTIAECYDGNPPYQPKGTPSQSVSVAELLRISKMLKDLEESIRENGDK